MATRSPAPSTVEHGRAVPAHAVAPWSAGVDDEVVTHQVALGAQVARGCRRSGATDSRSTAATRSP